MPERLSTLGTRCKGFMDTSTSFRASRPLTAGFERRTRSKASFCMNSIEKFLFASKRGHCELFATAAAVLLRMQGVPARLVTGFRLSSGPWEAGLRFRTGDAHAWLEYYLPEQGWKALDPTPRTLSPPALFGFVRDFYEELSTFWYRYIFNFDTARTGLFSLKTLREF